MKITMKITVILILTLLFSAGCKSSKNEDSKKLIIFHAGSLSVPFKQATAAFQKSNPGVNIIMEAAGSRTCARKISDLKKPCDIMASADYTVINTLLIPDHASWNIRFAANEMVLAYHKSSKLSDKINADNWYSILMDKRVSFGRSDPNMDPCGYRSVLTMKLAEKFYKKQGLARKMLAKNINFIRPKETDLLALLESHTIDYIFLYRSVTLQHKLKALILPDQINLKQASLKKHYKNVKVKISGKKPGTYIYKYGAPMVYGITIPNNSPNPKLAKAFIKFLLDPEKGGKIMKDNGQPSVVPAASLSYKNIPGELKRYAAKQ